jgi:hypothetical protein
MNEKELLKQLNNLKSVKADSVWKKENREILRNQIGVFDNEKIGVFSILTQLPPISFFRGTPHQAMAVFMIAFVMVGGGVYGISASKHSKPGDSLYIAKIMSEKTQLALTFNEKNKTRLNLEFAENRAHELSLVLAADEEYTEEKRDKVERLVGDFKKEISNAITRVERISRTGSDPSDARRSESREGEDKIAVIEEAAEEEVSVFSANMDKDDKGVQVSEKIEPTKDTKTETEARTEEKPASSTTPEIASTSNEKESETLSYPNNILTEVKELLKAGDYSGAIAKLEEAGLAIDQFEFGQVKGESATSSASVVEEMVIENTSDRGTSTEK